MHAYSITYGVYESNRIFKTGTVGVRLENRSTQETLKNYLQEAMSWMRPGCDVRILNWKEIGNDEYEKLFAGRMLSDQTSPGI